VYGAILVGKSRARQSQTDETTGKSDQSRRRLPDSINSIPSWSTTSTIPRRTAPVASRAHCAIHSTPHLMSLLIASLHRPLRACVRACALSCLHARNLSARVISELSMGPFCLTQSNPTHQLTDPTRPNPLQVEKFGPNPTQYN